MKQYFNGTPVALSFIILMACSYLVYPKEASMFCRNASSIHNSKSPIQRVLELSLIFESIYYNYKSHFINPPGLPSSSLLNCSIY